MVLKHNLPALLVTGTLLGLMLAAGVGAGCDSALPVMPDGKTPGTTGTFAGAQVLTYDAGGNAAISGTIVGNQADFYDLGPVSPGDRIIVTVDAAAGSSLDPTAAIFDANEELFALNDDVDLDAGQFGSAIDDVVAVGGPSYYLAVAKFFLDNVGGPYQGRVRIERGGPVPSPPVQVLLLNFAGGPVTIDSEGSFNLDPFDAADIDPVYAGQTLNIKNRIVEVVKENFTGTGLRIFSSDENPGLTPGTFSIIHFGAFSPTKFGVADGVDQGNQDCCDDGIVFTFNFDDPFAAQPSVNGIGTAIGNVGAHEAGHLLGLNHVADVTALMDNTGTASTLLADQDFKTAPLSPSVFPLGMQNAPALLARVIPP